MLMNKILRYSFVALMAMIGLNGMAQGVTFDFDNDYAKLFPTLAGTSSNDSQDGDFTAATTSTAVEGFTVTVSAADEGVRNANRIWSGAPRLRMYSGTFTVSGKGIKKIEFTGHNTNFNLSTTTGSLDGKVWTGEADEVVFAVAKNTQINKLVINGDGSTEPEPQPQVTEATCAEIIAGADGTNYRVTGKCTEIKNTTYGNWYLEDATGTVYIYGTLDAEGKTKNFSSLGIEVGDEITVEGPKKTYNGTVELVNVKVINIKKASQASGQVWDFTKWSDATIANLKADAAASAETGWSDLEAADGSKVNAEGRCFWYQGTVNEDGSLSANGVVIEELKGLKFHADYAAKRSLAIAVDYSSTSLGDYAGGAYLWLGGGGSKQAFPCFTIPAVKAGSKITVELESHKPSDTRGIGLYKNNYDAANLIGEQFKPTTKATNTWEIAEDCDVVVWNTSGCHIYTLKVEAGTASINTVKTTQKDGAIYNLAGQKVGKDYKGLVIKNGKKYVIK